MKTETSAEKRIKELEKILLSVCDDYADDCDKCPKQAECGEYYHTATREGGRNMKRFRDENGRLTKWSSEIAKLAAAEAATYYRVGGIYYSFVDFREYVYIANSEGIAEFRSPDGKQMFIPVANLGTFLPDVASAGMELVAVQA